MTLDKLNGNDSQKLKMYSFVKFCQSAVQYLVLIIVFDVSHIPYFYIFFLNLFSACFYICELFLYKAWFLPVAIRSFILVYFLFFFFSILKSDSNDFCCKKIKQLFFMSSISFSFFGAKVGRQKYLVKL